MEPAEASVTKTTYAFMTRVRAKENRKADPRPIDEEAKHPAGWYIQFVGSWEAIYFGEEDPGWKVGDVVKITMEKVT